MAHSESSDKKTTATLTIDGTQVTVPVGATILEAAAELGIKIPTLCWLKKVSTTGACRICVVKVEGVDRFMTACNTPVKDGIVVTTTSPELEAARKKTLELMLVNHPLDCPICDAAGECDLQDTCYGLQVDKNAYGAELERLPIRYDWKLLESDPNRCILCEKCVKVCREVVGREAIEIVDRGDNTIIDTITREPLNCDFCGNCINVCPTGTLISKPFKFRGRPWTFEVTPSICGFCSSGCEIEYHSANGRVERVTSSDDNYNKGNLCINGRFGYAAFNSSGRLTTPLIKDASGNQQKATWEQALGVVTGKLNQIVSVNGPDAVAGIGSPRVTNEESYLFQKFLRGAVGTNNIDSEARLGYLPSQGIQYDMIGYSGGTFPMDAIETAETVIVIGSDLKGESAGFAYRVIQASNKNNAKVVLVNSRTTSMNKYANAFLQCRPGSEAFLVSGLIKAVIEEGVANLDFIEKCTRNLGTFKASIDTITFAKIVESTGVSEVALREAARLINRGGRTALIYGSDIIRSTDMKNAVSKVVNLAILIGAVGYRGAGIYPLDEKNNTQGMLDMGVCPEYLPGYHTYEHVAAKFGAAWNCTVPSAPGRDLFQIIEGIEKGEIKALYVMGNDPLHFMLDRARVLSALQKLELLIVQDLFLTESARLATVVLPAASAAEKSGSFTSVDNRVQCFHRAIDPAGLARTDADILTELYSMVAPATAIRVQTPDELHHEISVLTGLYTETGDHDGYYSMSRVKNRLPFSDKPSVFATVVPETLAAPDAAYPFTAVIGPILHHNGSMTLWSDNNTAVSGQGYVVINPADAATAGIAAGAVVKISSGAGSASLPAQLSTDVLAGSLFIPSHFRESQVGLLLKGSANTVAVKLEKA
jgi:formate dehydrogenase alpha subunit